MQRPFLEIESDGTCLGTCITYDSRELRGLTEVAISGSIDDSIVEFILAFDLAVDAKEFEPIVVSKYVAMFDVQTLYIRTNGYSADTLIVINGKPIGFVTELNFLVSTQNPDSIKLVFKSLDPHLTGMVGAADCTDPVQFVYHNKKLYKYLPLLDTTIPS